MQSGDVMWSQSRACLCPPDWAGAQWVSGEGSQLNDYTPSLEKGTSWWGSRTVASPRQPTGRRTQTGAHTVNGGQLPGSHLVWFKEQLPGWRTGDGLERRACLFFLAPCRSIVPAQQKQLELWPSSRLRAAFLPRKCGLRGSPPQGLHPPNTGIVSKL